MGFDLEDRVPPHDLQAEAAILSTMLLDPQRCAEVIPQIDPADFYSDANQKVFEGMAAVWESGRPLDILTLRSHLEDKGWLERVGGARYLAEILDCVPAVSNVSTYCEIVRNKAKLRSLAQTCRLYTARAYEQGVEAQSLCEEAEDAVANVSRARGDKEIETIKSAVAQAMDTVHAASKSGVSRTGAPTGIRRLDEITGGWQSTDLIIVAARPGMGKTAFALQEALTVSRFDGTIFGDHGQKVAALVFSLEMPKSQLAMRLLCQEARCDLHLIRQGKVQKAPRDEWRYLTAAAGAISKARLYVDDESSPTPSMIRAKTMRAKSMLERQGMRLGLVVIDYLQITSTPADPTIKSRTEAVGRIARDFKKIARDAEVPVMACAQLNRGPEEGKGRRPRLSDLRDSGEIEQEADVVAFLYRPGYYERLGDDGEPKADPKAREPQDCEIIVAKQRNGPLATVEVGFTPAYTRFDVVAGEYDNVEQMPIRPN